MKNKLANICGRYRKLLSVASLLFFVLSVYSTTYSFTTYNGQNVITPQTNNMIFLLTVISFVSYLIVTVLLSYGMSDTFWINRRAAKKIDERQLYLRLRVFERSYQVLIGLVLVFLFIAPAIFSEAIDILAAKNAFIPGLLQLSYFLYSLPSVVGAWIKNTWTETE
jgi:hypothetical protein